MNAPFKFCRWERTGNRDRYQIPLSLSGGSVDYLLREVRFSPDSQRGEFAAPFFFGLMMNDVIKAKADEIALMFVMASANDQSSLKILVEICQDLAKAVQGDSAHARLVQAIEYIVSKSETGGDLYDALSAFAAVLGPYLDGQEVVWPGEHAGAPNQSANNDVSANIDAALLTEYIESHNLLLEEFESNLVAEALPTAELTAAVKRYLHNLKGDSGSIGVHGIERVCHHLEDLLESTPADQLREHLLHFKSWVSEYFKALTAGAAPKESADKFLASLGAAGPKPTSSAKTAARRESPKAAAKLQVYTLSGERDILVEFLTEAEEHLNNVESIILDCEGAYSKDDIDAIFRGVHSVKGGSAYFNIVEMTHTSHILENLLHEVRDGKRQFDQTLKEFILTYIDLQKDVLKRTRSAASTDGGMCESDACAKFLSSLEHYAKQAPGTAAPAAPTISAPTSSTPEQSAPVAAEGEQRGDKLNVKNFLKVETGRLDHLIDSIGEMVIYSSMLIKHCRELLGSNQTVMTATQRVEKFSRDLQDIGMSMRLVPVKGLFQKMSRLVWDVGKKLGKDITFSMEGEDTELDRNLIDKLADPLMHMVRNAVDHGIELPDARAAKGKPRTGHVHLAAYHSGGSIHIRVQDDGKGLDPQKLIAKAVEKGVISPNDKLSDEEAFGLIFAAGFSTATAVTDISGRGVGMDVVRRNVESLRGRIRIQSEVEKGSTFTIELPLTLAIIDGIQVRVGPETFIIPSLSIVEFVKPTKQMISKPFDSGETLEFRGKFLPIFRLAELYQLDASCSEICASNLVVVDNGYEQVAFMVDEIMGEISTVIKGLGPMFEEQHGVSGCAIMPDGDVALILDMRSLVDFARKDYSWRENPRLQRESQPHAV